MKKRGLFFFALAILFVLFFYAICVYPIPGSDSVVYLPAALLYAHGHGMINPVYYLSKFLEPTGADKFNYYVPLHPLLLGWLTKLRPEVKTIFLICWTINAASLMLYVRKIAALQWQDAKIGKAMAFLSISYIAMYILPTAGRPETLTMLLIMLLCLLYSKRNSIDRTVYHIGVSTLCGLMLSAQILSCFFCMLVIATYELLETDNVWKMVGVSLVRFVGVLAVCSGIMMLSPHGLIGTVTAVAHHASLAMGRPDRSVALFIQYWVFSPLNFAFLGIFCVAAYYYLNELGKKLKQAQLPTKVLAVLLQLMIAGGIVKFILYASPTVYNATQFILPISAYILYNFSKNGKQQKIPVITTALVFIGGSLIFLRSLVLFADYLQDGKTFDAAQPVVNAIFMQNKSVYVTTGLWALVKNQARVKVYRPGLIKSGDIVIMQQAGHEAEPEVEQMGTMIMDWRTAAPRKLMGIPITKRPQGYSFAVYKIK